MLPTIQETSNSSHQCLTTTQDQLIYSNDPAPCAYGLLASQNRRFASTISTVQQALIIVDTVGKK